MLTTRTNLSIFPVQALQLYTTAFGHTSGPILSFLSGHPVTHSIVTQQFNQHLHFVTLTQLNTKVIFSELELKLKQQN